MTLHELCEELFAYLIDYRERVTFAAGPSVDDLRKDLDDIFHRQREQVRNQPSLSGPYQQVLYALAAFSDEVVLTSGGPAGRQWDKHLLEERLFGTQVAGDRFFEQVSRMQGAPREVLEIYYLCLALGFTGHYQHDDEQLDNIKSDLLNRLGGTALPEGDKLFVEAYGMQSGENHKLPRVFRWRLALAVLVGLVLVLFLGDRFVIWPWETSEVRELAEMARLQTLTRTQTQQATKTKPRTPAKKPGKESSPEAAAPTVETETAWKKSTQSEPALSRPATTSDSDRGYLVQVAIYGEPDLAEQEKKSLEEQGFKARLVLKPRDENRNWHVLVLGPYASMEQAKQAEETVAKSQGIRPLIVDAWQYENLNEPGNGEPAVRPASTAGDKDQSQDRTPAEPLARPAEKQPEQPPARQATPPPAKRSAEPLARPAEKQPAQPPAKQAAPPPAKRPTKPLDRQEAEQTAQAQARPAPVEAGLDGAKDPWKDGYLVQAGVFVGPKDSGRAAKKLEKSSLPARVFKRSRSGGRWWHILVVGPYPDFNQASKVAAKVRELLKIEPLVIFAREFADQAGQGE